MRADVTIYHNPHCSKSRQTLQLLRDKGVEPLVIEYLKDPPSKTGLKKILSFLGMAPRDLMRKQEAIYKEAGLDDPRLTRDELIAAKRLSPPLLISLLELTGKEYHEHLLSLNPFDEAVFGVAWAGQERSENWFHIAREYTEKFIHQQQIRDALGKEPLFSEILFRPFISTLMYALPVAYKNTEAPEGTIIALQIGSATGEEYRIIRNYNGWSLTEVSEAIATSTIQMNPDTAWKVFSKGISPEMALEQVTITGNAALGKITLEMVAVMA
ncbi:MAG: arsenate reductase family protein [Sediminibacterium sp.]